MRDETNQNENPASLPTQRPGELSSAARRAMLLKGLSKGAAGIAVAAPIKSFAVIPSVTEDGRLCSISGFKSTGHSVRPIENTCVGHSPGYWMNNDPWPAAYSKSDKFLTIFGVTAFKDLNPARRTGNPGGQPPAAADITLLMVLQNYQNTEEFHWVAALLNAAAGAQGMWGTYVYPLSSTEVIAYYNGSNSDGHSYTEALNFIKQLEGTI